MIKLCRAPRKMTKNVFCAKNEGKHKDQFQTQAQHFLKIDEFLGLLKVVLEIFENDAHCGRWV